MGGGIGAVADAVEDGFENDGVGADVMGVDGAEDGGGAHTLTVQDEAGVGQVAAGERQGGGHVFGLQPAEGGIGFRRAARSAEVHEQDGSAHGVEFAGFAQEAGFLGGVAMEENPNLWNGGAGGGRVI